MKNKFTKVQECDTIKPTIEKILEDVKKKMKARIAAQAAQKQEKQND